MTPCTALSSWQVWACFELKLIKYKGGASLSDVGLCKMSMPTLAKRTKPCGCQALQAPRSSPWQSRAGVKPYRLQGLALGLRWKSPKQTNRLCSHKKRACSGRGVPFSSERQQNRAGVKPYRLQGLAHGLRWKSLKRTITGDGHCLQKRPFVGTQSICPLWGFLPQAKG